ncbi:hypothetical protein I4U23_031333 [Adineta vaga]|nr:hypothetical protein I4U23_031333 [Adineta vaga]
MDKALPILGIWIPSDDGDYYIRSTQFISNKPGYQFKPDGQFIQRQNVGWCGTPPITYGNYEGRWKVFDKTTLTVNGSNWRENYTKNLKYQFLTDDDNKVKFQWLD